MKPYPIVIIGAGIIGLSTGIRLLERKFPVTIIAAELSPYTTSDTAPACWHPYINPSALLHECIYSSWARLQTQIKEIPHIVKKIRFQEFLPDRALFLEEHNNLCQLENYRELSANELPTGYEGGCEFTTVVIDIHQYMPFLQHKFLKLGGKLEQRKINSLNEFQANQQIIVNCSGSGARELVNDQKVAAVRGQALSLTKITSIDYARLAIIKDSPGYPDHPDYTIIVPRENDIYIAGTTQANDWDRMPREADSQLILQRAIQIAPELKQARIEKTYVGLRPERLSLDNKREVRIEFELLNNQPVFHNYGHSGAGVSAALGSADKIGELIEKYGTG